MSTTFEPPASPAESATAERPPNGQPVRIVLVDRDSLARRALRDELTGTGELIVAAEAADADEALQSVRRERPDLVLIDIGYPLMSGIGVAKELRSQQPSTPIVFCSITGDEDTAIRALSVGAVGYVSKDLASGPLVRALRGALAGEAAVSRHLARRLIEELSQHPEPRPRLRPTGGELTSREWQVLDLLIEGRSTALIADTLGLALETVRSHIKHVLRKLGVGSRGEAVAIARRLRARRP
jgi:DNA-binding NarL/FixJ family response regulator